MARRSSNVSSQPLGKDNVCRDIYGFTIRPQHLQRYLQYATIYKEEEAERSARWESFLTRYHGLGAGNRVNREDDAVDEVAKGGIDAETKLETWADVRPSLGPVEQVMLPYLRKAKSIDATDGPRQSREEANLSTDGSDEGFKEVSLDDVVLRSNVNEHNEPCPWKEELDTLVHGGVPMALRGEVWQVFVGAKKRRTSGHYQALLTLLADGGGDSDGVGGLYNGTSNNYSISETGIFEKWTNQIEKDLPRTFPGHPALDEDGRNALRRLLTAYARHNPDVGYCQAMNFFAALLLLMMPEENAFWTLTGFMDDYFEGYYSEKMLESQVDQLVLDELVHEYFPRLVSHMEALGVQVTWVTGPWFLSIFVNVLPWESVLRVWDVILYDGNRSMLFRTALALLEQHGSAIMAAKDAGDAVSALQSLVGSTFDSSQLVLIACMGYENVDESLLQELRAKNRPKVLAAISERSLWRSKTKSFSLKTHAIHGKTNDSAKVATDCNNDFTNEQQIPVSEHLKNTTAISVMVEDLDGIQNDDIDDEEISIADLVDQIKWLKIELSQALVQCRAANLRAEELETAFMELVKEDNRRWLSAKVESLEDEVARLRKSLAEKEEQEQAMLKAMLKMEQEQQAADAARRYAEDDATTQRNIVNVLQVKYEDAIASLKEMEKRTIMAESTLAATMQYEALGNSPIMQPKATNGEQGRWAWPRFTLRPAESTPVGPEVQVGSAELADELAMKKGTMTQITDPQKQGFLSRWREK